MNPFLIGLLGIGSAAGYTLYKKKAQKSEATTQAPTEPTVQAPSVPTYQQKYESYTIGVNKEEYRKLLAVQEIDASMLKTAVESGNKAVFFKPHTALYKNKDYEKGADGKYHNKLSPSDKENGVLTIILDDWGNFHYFSSLLAVGFFLSHGEQKQIGEAIIDWFMYHRWRIGDSLKKVMLETLADKSCSKESRLPAHSHQAFPHVWDTRSRFFANDRWKGGNKKVYPAVDEWEHKWDENNKKIALACHVQTDATREGRNISREEVIRVADKNLGLNFWGIASVKQQVGYRTEESFFFDLAKDSPKVRIGPCGAMLEYAAARYGQIAFCTAIDPKLGAAAGQQLLETATQAASLIAAGVVGAIAGSTSMTPVGWVLAAAAAAIAAISSFFGMHKTRKKTWDTRTAIAKQLDNMFKDSSRKYGVYNDADGLLGPTNGLKNLSGHRLDMLVKQTWIWNDIDDPLWHNFALGNSAAAWGEALAQLPFYLVGIDFCMAISVTVPTNRMLCIEPLKGKGGATTGFKWKTYSFAEYEKLLRSMGKQVQALTS